MPEDEESKGVYELTLHNIIQFGSLHGVYLKKLFAFVLKSDADVFVLDF